MIVNFKVFSRTSQIGGKEWCLASGSDNGRSMWVYKTYKKEPTKEQINEDISLVNGAFSYHHEYMKPEKVTAKIGE